MASAHVGRRTIQVATMLAVLGSVCGSAGVAAGVPSAFERARAAGPTEPKPAQQPVRFLGHVVRLLAANDYRAAYPLLHPEQRRLFSSYEYVACEQSSPIPGKLSSLRVLDSHRERIHVAGTRTESVASTAVSFELQLVGSIPGEAVTVDLTAHAVSVAGRLTWILSARRLALHRSGTCGAIAN